MLNVRVKFCVFLLLGVLALEKVQIGHAAGPCEGSSICGSGAKCESRSNMAVCVCPEGTVGDPFVACRPTPIASSTSTNRNNGMTSTTIYSSSSSSPSSPQYTSSSSSSPHYTSSSSSSYDMSPTQQNSRPTTYHHSYSSSSSSPSETVYTSSPTRTHLGPIAGQSNYNDNYRTNHYESHRYNDNGNNQHRSNYHSENSNNYNHRPHEFANTNIIRRHDQIGFDRNNDNYHNRVYQDSSSSSSSNGPINGHHMNSNSNYEGRHHDSEHVRDPLGVYSNCKQVNGIVVCADESDSSSNNGQMTKNYDSKPIVHHSASSSSSSSSNHDQNYVKPYVSSSNQNTDFVHRSSSYDDQPKPISGQLQEFVVKSDNQNSPVHSKSPTQMNDERRGSAINHNNNIVPESGNPETCKKYCGVNSVCRMLLGRPICGCPEGYTGDPSVRCSPAEDQKMMSNRCSKPTDCSENMVCEHGQCLDPCKKTGDDHQSTSSRGTMSTMQEEGLRNTFSHYHSNRRNNSRGGRSSDMDSTTMPVAGSGRDKGSLCGRNTKCQVIQHTALCGCLEGFSGNPYNGCV